MAILAWILPSSQSECEGGNLRAARIEFQAEKVIPQDSFTCFFCCQAVVMHPERYEEIEGRHQEMPAAAAGVKHLELGQHLGPAVEGARCGQPVVSCQLSVVREDLFAVPPSDN